MVVISKLLVSVVVLKERLINQEYSLDMPFFEESIYVVELEMEKKSNQELALDIRKKLKQVTEFSYQNEFGEEIS